MVFEFIGKHSSDCIWVAEWLENGVSGITMYTFCHTQIKHRRVSGCGVSWKSYSFTVNKHLTRAADDFFPCCVLASILHEWRREHARSFLRIAPLSSFVARLSMGFYKWHQSNTCTTIEMLLCTNWESIPGWTSTHTYFLCTASRIIISCCDRIKFKWIVPGWLLAKESGSRVHTAQHRSWGERGKRDKSFTILICSTNVIVRHINITTFDKKDHI